MVYRFEDKIKEGEAEEARLDIYFSKWYLVLKVSQGMQKNGIDRRFIDKKDGRIFLVEYKADSKASKTGNAFIETVSVDVDGKKGWAYTSWAQQLVYFVPPTGEILLIPMLAIKMHLPSWVNKYREVPSPNIGQNGKEYNTLGLLVPLPELRKLSKTKILTMDLAA